MDQLPQTVKDNAVGLIVVAMIAATIIVAIVMHYLFLIIRGYPDPGKQARECEHEENMTGLCLKNPNCKTQSECQTAVHNYRGH